MKNINNESVSLVRTIKERCRVCYTCVRECPAKAIRISGGQAEIIIDRCIGCGNCVRVCSQKAKQVKDCTAYAQSLLDMKNRKVVACLAPSFPAEFHGIDYRKVVGMLRKLGFTYVTEVAFGADIVAAQYNKLINESSGEHYIATTCPSIVSYVEKYFPNLVKRLAPIVSPMVAMARILKQFYGDNINVVFIGPCIAKKEEADKEQVKGDIAAAITFVELKKMLDDRGINWENVEESNFDPPHPSKGTLFPIGRGMLEAAELKEDLLTNEVVATDGTKNFVQALKEFDDGSLSPTLLEVLSCNGCIMGSGMTAQTPSFTRRTDVSKYACQRLSELRDVDWEKEKEKFDYIDLSTKFSANDHRLPAPSRDELKEILGNMGKTMPEDELNCGACGYDTCIEHAIAIHKGLAENEMCLPYTIEKLKETASELSHSYQVLVNTKNALVQSEKLASMGQLAAGIAHEVNNPLGIVLLYAHLILEQVPKDSELYDDIKMIVEQSDRAKKIVSGLLNFARKNKVVLRKTDMNELINMSLSAIIVPGNVRLKINHRKENIVANLDPDQMIQVLANLFNNAIEAMPEGGVLEITSDSDPHSVYIEVRDTGIGIDRDNLKKIFEPFFTTKQMGKGTGLGLAVTYGIIKMHKGSIEVESVRDSKQNNGGTTFKITLPINEREEILEDMKIKGFGGNYE